MRKFVPYSVAVTIIACIAMCSLLVLSTQAEPLASKGNAGKGNARRMHRRFNVNPKSKGKKNNDKPKDKGDDNKPQPQALSCVYVNGNTGDPNTGEPSQDFPNYVAAYVRDKATGRLTFRGKYFTGGLGDPFVGGFQQHSVVSDGKYLYAVNPGNNTITAFEVNKDCSLRRIEVEGTNGERPVSIALSKDLLVVANSGHSPAQLTDIRPASYSTFRIKNDGSLEPICTVSSTPGQLLLPKNPDDPDSGLVPTSVYTLADVAFNKSGDVLVGTGLLPNVIESFQVSRHGCLIGRRTISGGGGPFPLLFNPARPNQLFVATAVPEVFGGERAPSVDSYIVSKTGQLTLVDSYSEANSDPLSNEGLRDPCWFAITPNGQYLWVSSFIPAELTLFRIERDGRITRVSVYDPVGNTSNPEARGSYLGSTDIAIDPAGRYLYQLRAFDVPTEGATPIVPQIHVLQITGNWAVMGGLRLVQVVNLPADLASSGVMGLVVVDRGIGRN